MRTGIAAMVGCYGPASAARRVIQGVTNMHAKVEGATPKGEAYRALDTELLDWVAATAGYGFLIAYERFVAPVSEADKARFFRDGAAVARLYGARECPRSPADFLRMMEARASRFEPHPIVDEFLTIIKTGKGQAGALGFFYRAIARAAVSLLPPMVRARLQLGPEYDLRGVDRTLVRAAAAVAERFPAKNSPATRAPLRFGLPAHPPAAVKGVIKRADIICAYFEAVQLAGFSETEAKRFFGTPPRGIALKLKPQPVSDVQEAFLKRFRSLIDPA